MMKKLSLVFVLLLTGCLATTNLLSDESTLKISDKLIALEIAEKTLNLCVRVTYEQGSETKISSDVNFSKLPEVKRFFKSNAGWYKAYIFSNRVWDNVYYHPVDFKFICGDKSWAKYSDSNKIIFDELGIPIKTLQQAPTFIPAISSTAANSKIEERLKLLKDLRSTNLISEKQFDEQVKKALE